MVTTYDAKDTTIVIDDVYITGLGEDMVTGEREEDLFASSVGAQGDVVKSVTNNPLGKITINVQVTSPQRKFLMSLANRSEPFPIWCSNMKLEERMGGTMANLLTFPEISRGAEAGDMEFVFQVFDYIVE